MSAADANKPLAIIPPVLQSPFADPNYGFDHPPGHPIHSNPTWSLEENQKAHTGWVGIGVIVLGAILIAQVKPQASPQLPNNWIDGFSLETRIWMQSVTNLLWEWRIQILMLVLFFAMFLVETLCFKVQRRHFDLANPRVLTRDAALRIFTRWLALGFCFALAFALYCALGEYRFDLVFWPEEQRPHYYARYARFFVAAACAAMILSLPYFWLVETFAKAAGPVDEYLILGRCLRKFFVGAVGGVFNAALRSEFHSAIRNEHVHNLFRGLLVKFFFAPLMLLWALDQWNAWQENAHLLIYDPVHTVWSDPHHIAFLLRHFHHAIFNLLCATDLTVALLGYICSVRLLDTQTTSAEPTFFGWMVAICCYPPFGNALMGIFLGFNGIDTWIVVHVDSPIMSILSSVTILLIYSVYIWGTFAFGLRFSNLTNRGIVFNGPFKWIRHPAYLTKNLAWWIESLTFMSAGRLAIVNSLHLLAWGIIYFFRAWTEERHLMREPHYREYCKKVRYRFIPGIF